LDELRSRFEANAQRNLFVTMELLRLLHLFELQGILAIPFKGPVLATTAYGNLSYREFSDLDIIVRKSEFLRARDLLLTQQYRLYHPLPSNEFGKYIERNYNYAFIYNQSSVMLEVHWRIVETRFIFPFDMEHLWQNSQTDSLMGRPVLGLSAEDLLLILCVHGSKHSWMNLSMIVDVAELLRSKDSINWQYVVEQANKLRNDRTLLLGLLLASQLLQAKVPQNLIQDAIADKAVRSRAKLVIEHLYSGEISVLGRFEDCAFQIQLRQRFWDKLVYLVLVQPTITPVESAPSHIAKPAPRLVWMYYLFLVMRLLRKYLRGITRTLKTHASRRN
jgi:hypothetical protein